MPEFENGPGYNIFKTALMTRNAELKARMDKITKMVNDSSKDLLIIQAAIQENENWMKQIASAEKINSEIQGSEVPARLKEYNHENDLAFKQLKTELANVTRTPSGLRLQTSRR